MPEPMEALADDPPKPHPGCREDAWFDAAASSTWNQNQGDHNNSRRKERPVKQLLRTVFMVAVASLALPIPLQAQARDEPRPDSPILREAPSGRPYRSWSLFLVCNPAWLLPESEPSLKTLLTQFRAFGDAIGPDHLAVWFAGPGQGAAGKTAWADVVRSAAFCQSLKLAPGGSPYVVVTSDYPGEGRLSVYPKTFPTELTKFSVVSLAQTDADGITRVLIKLANELVTNKTSDLDPQSEAFWRAWERSYKEVRAVMLDLFKGISVTVKTPFFEVTKKN